MSVQRLRTDFQFAILTLFGVIVMAGVLPFAVYRFVQDQPLAGIVDLTVVLSVCVGVVYIWRGGDLEVALTVVLSTLTVACLVAIKLVGPAVLPWMYPLLLGSYLVVSRGKAVTLSVLAIGIVLVDGSAFAGALEAASFAVTALVVSLFAFIFAHRTRSQRQQLQALVTLDALTGAFNRRAMAHEMQVAIDAARRSDSVLGLAVLDLDSFKRVNDVHGHEAGDRVLVDFAQLVTGTTRKGDRFFRLGGEEFVLLLPGADEAALQALCESLRKIVAEHLRVQSEPVTVSIGAATLAPGEATSDWLARADAAMYRAKHQGRNRVVVDELPGADETTPL